MVMSRTSEPKLLLIVWALIIVFTGSFFRLRVGDEVPSLDWLIMIQLAVCALGIAIAMPRLLLIKRRPAYVWLIVLYVGAIGITLPWSINPSVSTGYFVLLAGGILTTLALVQQSDSQADLLGKEAFLSGVLIFCLLKDVLIAFIIGGESESGRLGIGDSANELSILAVVVFMMQLGRQRRPVLRYALQGFCLVVMVLAESRGSMISLVIGAAVYFWKAVDERRERQITLKLAASSLVLTALVGGIFLYLASFSGIQSAVRAFNRNEDTQSMEALSNGRTDVWNNALHILHKEPLLHFVVGNGYGLSRLVLNFDNGPNDDFFPHAHNTVLESLVSSGLVGTAALIMLTGCALIAAARRKDRSAHPLASRAAAVICSVITTFPTESYFSTKLSWMHIAFVFYLCILSTCRKTATDSVRYMHSL